MASKKTQRIASSEVVLKRCIGGWAGRIDGIPLTFKKGTCGHYRWSATMQGGDPATGAGFLAGHATSLTFLVWALEGSRIPGQQRAKVYPGWADRKVESIEGAA